VTIVERPYATSSTTPHDRAERTVRGFVTGGFVAFVLALVLPSVCQVARDVMPIPRVLLSPLWDLPIPLSMGAGGMVAGRALGRAWRGTVAIGLSMLIAGAIQVAILGDVGQLTGRENPLVVVTLELAVGLGAFACGGACGCRLMGGIHPGGIWKVTAGFAAGGLLAGVAGVSTFLLARAGASAVLGRGFALVLLLCQALNILGPFVASGVGLARALDDRSSHGGGPIDLAQTTPGRAAEGTHDRPAGPRLPHRRRWPRDP
jgi:hypothetical protein